MTAAEVIERLQRAKEGSRGLDALICESVFDITGPDNPCLWAPEMLDRGAVAELEPPAQIRSFTNSLDAAVTLVPAGWSWQVRLVFHGEHSKPVGRAIVARDRSGMVLADEHFEVHAATPALALCIAALRARAA